MNYEERSLAYHASEPRGKIEVRPKKSVLTQDDLSLAYSPGVAGPSRKIAENKELSFTYTGRANLVGVVTNGSAVLGLGNIGPEAAKPVMEGKAMLFKKYADIDVFDIEVRAEDPDKFIEIVSALEPTFGGINLEDIRAPECFYIEEQLRKRMSIPVFHDDQHGTAIISGAAFINAIEITHRDISSVRVVFCGGGAAAIACARLFIDLGVQLENILMVDSKGVLYEGRSEGMNPYKAHFVRKTDARTLSDAMMDADAFLGVSSKDLLTADMIKKMNKNPIIFALANPDPEIDPKIVKQVRPDAIIATGRSDYPNQVNNVLGFPFIFRGALDVGATCINEAMKQAAAKAIAELAKENVTDQVLRAYNASKTYRYGKDYLIPKPVDTRVLLKVAPAVAKAAMESGCARYSIDLEQYQERMEGILGASRRILHVVKKRIHSVSVKEKRKTRIALAYGTEEITLRAAEQIYKEELVEPVLIGDPLRVKEAAERLEIRDLLDNIQVIDPSTDERRSVFKDMLFDLRGRKGMSKTTAEHLCLNHNYFACLMLRKGDCDGFVTGMVEPYSITSKPILEILGVKKDRRIAGTYMMVIKNKVYFFSDCTMNTDPDVSTLVDITESAVRIASRYTKEPLSIGLLHYSNYGSVRNTSSQRMVSALEKLRALHPDWDIDGEMQSDVALNSVVRKKEFPFSTLKNDANVLIFPNLESANIAYKMLASLDDETTPIGPILSGINFPANIVQRSATVEEVIDMIYITADQACHYGEKK